MASRLLGDATAAEDVASEAMVKTFLQWSKVSGLEYRDAWVMRVTTNLALNQLRRRPIPPPEVAPVSTEDATATRLALVAALELLPPRQQEVIVLRYLAGLPEAKVASVLGIAETTVKTHVQRGLEALRGRLVEDWAAS